MLKSGKKTVGVKQTMKAVENGTAKVVFIAGDVDEKVVSALRELCTEKSVQLIPVDTMKQLGKACGIDVNASAACILH